MNNSKILVLKSISRFFTYYMACQHFVLFIINYAFFFNDIIENKITKQYLISRKLITISRYIACLKCYSLKNAM